MNILDVDHIAFEPIGQRVRERFRLAGQFAKRSGISGVHLRSSAGFFGGFFDPVQDPAAEQTTAEPDLLQRGTDAADFRGELVDFAFDDRQCSRHLVFDTDPHKGLCGGDPLSKSLYHADSLC